VVMGTNGSLAVPTMRLKRYPRKEDRSWFEPFQSETIPLHRTDPLAAQIEHFVAVIRGSADPLVTARDGLQNLRVMDAILERPGRARQSKSVPKKPEKLKTMQIFPSPR
jgi:predicted dehydrogenase